MQVSRAAVRALVEKHARQQFEAEREGTWHRTQNDINDELNEAISEIAAQAGPVAGERFGRLYAEEILALERDMRANPDKNARRLFGEAPQRHKTPQHPALPTSQRPVWPVLLLLVIGGLALFL